MTEEYIISTNMFNKLNPTIVTITDHTILIEHRDSGVWVQITYSENEEVSVYSDNFGNYWDKNMVAFFPYEELMYEYYNNITSYRALTTNSGTYLDIQYPMKDENIIRLKEGPI
tara:strand:+ start:9420 stop:9761 length:342 start_codon:yes stop_codon:yes gene_type:complete